MPFVCVSLGGVGFKTCMDLLRKVEFAEIRLDRMEIELVELRQIFSSHKNLIATYRGKNEKGKTFLKEAIVAGARYVDLDINSDEEFKEEIKVLAKSHRAFLILSFHDFERTRKKDELEKIARDAFKEGADFAKIACFVRSDRDNLELLSLLSEKDLKGKTIVIGMGEKGKITRVLAPLFGSPFTYASFKEGIEMAEGRIEREVLEGIYRLWGER